MTLVQLNLSSKTHKFAVSFKSVYAAEVLNVLILLEKQKLFVSRTRPSRIFFLAQHFLPRQITSKTSGSENNWIIFITTVEFYTQNLYTVQNLHQNLINLTYCPESNHKNKMCIVK